MYTQVHLELGVPDQRGMFLETPVYLLEETQTRTSFRREEFSVLKVLALPSKDPLGLFSKQGIMAWM